MQDSRKCGSMAEGVRDDKLCSALNTTLPIGGTEVGGSCPQPAFSASIFWHPVTTLKCPLSNSLFLLESYSSSTPFPAVFLPLIFEIQLLSCCYSQPSALFFLYFPSETLFTIKGSTTSSKLLTPKSLFPPLAPLSRQGHTLPTWFLTSFPHVVSFKA